MERPPEAGGAGWGTIGRRVGDVRGEGAFNLKITRLESDFRELKERIHLVRKAIVLASLSRQMKLKWPRPFAPTNPQSAAVGHRRCEGNLSVGSEKLLKAMSFFFFPS